MSRRPDDWFNRINFADIYHRKEDPFRPPPGAVPLTAPPASLQTPDQLAGNEGDVYKGWITNPTQRPIVFQTAQNYQLAVGNTPIALLNNSGQADTIVIDNPSSNGNSVFFGFGSGVTATSGIEIVPGIPVTISPDNTREQWELQRMLEVIAAMIAAERGYNPPGTFISPRVVMDPHAYYLIASVAGPTNIAVMIFNTPQLQ